MDIGAGLSSFAFWGFVAAMVVAGTWDGVKKRDAQHETLRRMIESGKPVDEGLMKRLMIGEPKRPDRDLAVSTIIMLSIAAGLVVFAGLTSGSIGQASAILMGVAALVAGIGVGLGLAAALMRWTRSDDNEASQRTRGG